MKMKRRSWITALAILTFSVTALPLIAAPASAASIELKFAHQNPPKGRTTTHVIDAYIKKIEEATRGKVKITSYPAQSLLKAKEVITGVETGIADMAWAPLGYFTGRFPLTTVNMLPFMSLESGEKNSIVMQTLYETLPEVRKEYRSVKMLFLHASDPYFLATSKKKVHNLEDIKGMKLRIMGAYPIMATKLLGASPLFTDMPAVYESAEKGILDGAALPWAAIATFNLYEVFPQYTEVDLWGVPFMIYMNLDKWNSLPPDVQKEIDSVSGMKAAAWAGKAGWGSDVREDALAKAKKEGKTMEKVSLDPGQFEKWKKIAGEPVWKAWVDEMNKKGLPGKKVLDTMNSLLEKYK